MSEIMARLILQKYKVRNVMCEKCKKEKALFMCMFNNSLTGNYEILCCRECSKGNIARRRIPQEEKTMSYSFNVSGEDNIKELYQVFMKLRDILGLVEFKEFKVENEDV